VHWLVSAPLWALLVGWTAVAVAAAVVGHVFVSHVVHSHERAEVRGLAYPLMPALGAMFAVLTAITLSSEAGYLKSAQDGVSEEAAAASRLAWAATNPNVDPEPIHATLDGYLVAIRTNEWSGDDAATGDDPQTADALADLERAVRSAAADTAVGTPGSTELLAAVDAVSSGRRGRLADGSRELPALYIVTLIVSGLALVANAGAIVSAVSRRSALLVAGLTIVVALSLALLCALTGPFRGALAVSGEPIDAVIDDLRTGFFTRS
jgi:hypothetical protein